MRRLRQGGLGEKAKQNREQGQPDERKEFDEGNLCLVGPVRPRPTVVVELWMFYFGLFKSDSLTVMSLSQSWHRHTVWPYGCMTNLST